MKTVWCAILVSAAASVGCLERFPFCCCKPAAPPAPSVAAAPAPKPKPITVEQVNATNSRQIAASLEAEMARETP